MHYIAHCTHCRERQEVGKLLASRTVLRVELLNKRDRRVFNHILHIKKRIQLKPKKNRV